MSKLGDVLGLTQREPSLKEALEQVILFNAEAKTDGRIRLQCYDEKGKLVRTFKTARIDFAKYTINPEARTPGPGDGEIDPVNIGERLASPPSMRVRSGMRR